MGLLGLIVAIILAGRWGQWAGIMNSKDLINSLLLFFGVGCAEEIIFRGWLWNELNFLLKPRNGLLIQAMIFSLVHTRFNLGPTSTLGLLIGLFLLGVVLAELRHRNNGSLWPSIGLHGGLVSIWFLLDKGLVNFSSETPAWLIGPGGENPNPIGGIAGWALLSTLLIAESCQRKAVR
jgi:membrane protease YdiL (CAAX protease family)